MSLHLDTIIKIFSSILYEQKLIFISNELGSLTRLIHTFVCLLYPFTWPHTYVPILPALMLDIIQAPTPYIIGILRSCESYLLTNDDLISQDNSDILIVDIDHDRIRSFVDYLTNESARGSVENLGNVSNSQYTSTAITPNVPCLILPKIFKIELKQEISLLRKNRTSLSLDDCQQRIRDVFMSVFVQSCYNYREYLHDNFDRHAFIQSKQHTIELFLEWFTQTQIFQLFIREKLDTIGSYEFPITFDVACKRFSQSLNKPVPQRITVKSVKRKSATRANKHDHRF
jgi:DENN domain-containing protein 2